MEAPDVWLEFCKYFHQDFLLVYGSVVDAVGAFTENSSNLQIIELSDFIDALIASQLTEEQLRYEWQQCGAQIEVRYTTMRNFLMEIKALLTSNY